MIARNETIYFRKCIEVADACDSKTNSTCQLENKNLSKKQTKTKQNKTKQTNKQ